MSLSLFLKKLKQPGAGNFSFFFLQLFLILVVGVAVIFFISRTLQKTSAQIAQTRAAITDHQDRVQFLSSLQTDYAQLKKDLPRLYDLLPQESALGDVVTRLDKLADDFGISIDTKIGTKIQDQTIAYIPLTISTQAPVDIVQRYIKALEQMPFVLNVTSITFDGAVGQKSPAVINAQLFIR